jgi:hypothetical protein
MSNPTADPRKVSDVDLRALIQVYEHQAKGGVALAPFPREVVACLTELAGYRRMKDATGHVIGHPSNCRVNNGMDMSCSCGIEP